jgi:glutamate-ammonia-ligase adenylyltransferase
VQIDIESDKHPYTRLQVSSQDTPAFLYSMSAALALHGLSIEHVRIETIEGSIQDTIDVVDSNGNAIRDEATLNKIRLSILLTKQFTYFLDRAPAPYDALSRFEKLVQTISDVPEKGNLLDQLSNPHMMRDLARLLGASDFLWEDFIRLQYEELIPILQPQVEGKRISDGADTLDKRLDTHLAGAATIEEKKARLNEFKNREVYLIDLDHILVPGVDFRVLSRELSRLAEEIVRAAARIVYDDLVHRHGKPQTVAGLEAKYAIMGLGKLGGGALGYASDIELLFVYSDNGETAGPKTIGNAEFFSHLARETSLFIESKREGIFEVDLRLRPYGSAGPLACSLESFCRYYGRDGAAHSYERLALVRLSTVGGDPELGARIERLRDEFVYASASIDLTELRDLRARQFEEKNRPGQYNAKFSPGALVDLEYAVQILQVTKGVEQPALRTPRIHEALDALTSAGIMPAEESERLAASYDFLRQLINGLRMLRGSAKDLFLPAVDSDEFVHLARRMGYRRERDLSPAQQLFIEFETRTAAVRAFVDRHFGRDSLPGPATGNVADLVLADDSPEDMQTTILKEAGFTNPNRAYRNLRKLAGGESRRDLFAKLAVLACDMLKQEPDPDMALNNWERFVDALDNAETHYAGLFSQPRKLQVLLSIFSRSQFLADSLMRNPEFIDWVTDPANLHDTRSRDTLIGELKELALASESADAWRDTVRRFRRREHLRIGTRDICLQAPIEEIIRDLSNLADAILHVSVEQLWARFREEGLLGNHPGAEEAFCILAMGKLGGRELNYSSDIDLIGVFDDEMTGSTDSALFNKLLKAVHKELSDHTAEGYAYRVDLRLRPYGSAGDMAPACSRILSYYQNKASLWEIQALLKCRPVAGQLAVGQRLLEKLKPLLLETRALKTISASIRKLRDASIQQDGGRPTSSTNIKNGVGGIRDIEFLAQGLQLAHAAEEPNLLTGHTLTALERLAETNLLENKTASKLKNHYTFLRRIEHCLQILEDQQIHDLPTDAHELTALARRVLGRDARASALIAQIEACRNEVRDIYNRLLDTAQN